MGSKLSRKTIIIIAVSITAAVIIAAVIGVLIFKNGVKSGNEAGTESTAEDQSVQQTSAETDEPGAPEFINPLTGLEAPKDFSSRRPVAVMINNIKQALPQEGITSFDIMYECLAEGGVTRMMGISSDWENLPVVGSIRSSRDYYLDFAQDFDAIYVHAGGSDLAYANIASRGINNICGVRGPRADTIYKDQNRLKHMASEHCSMTTGPRIAEAVESLGYRTDIRDGFDSPLDFMPYGETFKPENSATHIAVPFSGYQKVDFAYDGESGVYLRYQYNGMPHVDNTTGDQLVFKNVFILFCVTRTVDDYGRLGVTTTGSGEGYYATEGAYMPIVWKKDNRDSSFRFYDKDGNELNVNRGKTMINVCTTEVKSSIVFDDKWTIE